MRFRQSYYRPHDHHHHPYIHPHSSIAQQPLTPPSISEHCQGRFPDQLIMYFRPRFRRRLCPCFPLRLLHRWCVVVAIDIAIVAGLLFSNSIAVAVDDGVGVSVAITVTMGVVEATDLAAAVNGTVVVDATKKPSDLHRFNICNFALIVLIFPLGHSSSQSLFSNVVIILLFIWFCFMRIISTVLNVNLN